MQNAEFFAEAGGQSLHYIPALNARDDHADLLQQLVSRHTAGWADADDPAELNKSRDRARAKGAAA